MLEANDIKR